LGSFHHPALQNLFWLLQLLALAQSHARAAAVFVGEFSADKSLVSENNTL
jgi:hypothetical protein